MVFNQKLVAIVKVGGKVLREQNVSNGSGEVYIPFGSEYELEFKNMHTTTAHVSVEIDGKDVLDGHQLLIKPNSKQQLERFIVDDNMHIGPRFKFIEKTEKISNNRGDFVEDGIIAIIYQFEEKHTYYRLDDFIYNPVMKVHHHHYYPRVTYPHVTWTSGTTIPDNCAIPYSVTADTHTYCCGDLGDRQISAQNAAIKAGITVMGQESDQSFHKTHSTARLEQETHSIALYLRGYKGEQKVSQPILTKTKLKCSVCGTTNKSNMKFCGECGNNLEY